MIENSKRSHDAVLSTPAFYGKCGKRFIVQYYETSLWVRYVG